MGEVELIVDDELRSHCRQILEMKWPLQDWVSREGGDYFQSLHYCGGFEADDAGGGAFTFSRHDDTRRQELWFEFTLDDVPRILDGTITTLKARLPD